MTIAWLAYLLDTVIGDPRTAWHPVVLIGKLIAKLEDILYDESHSDNQKLITGGALMLTVLFLSYSAAAFLLELVDGLNILVLSVVFNAALLSFTISPRSLAEAGREIRQYLENGDLASARQKVGWIVGRDTENLSVGDATRATVETISENIVDGITSPLFYFFLGGLPLAFAYRAANTMDSMIGYKNDKYLFFGRVAARCDDLWNYVPARLTGGLLIVAALLCGYDWRNAWRMMRRDAAKHPSPNGGYTEATVAGALGIRLGGLNYYFGQPSFRTYMGEPVHELWPLHIRQATRLMYASSLLFLVVLTALSYLLRGTFL